MGYTLQCEINSLKELSELIEHYSWEAFRLKNELSEIEKNLQELGCMIGENGIAQI